MLKTLSAAMEHNCVLLSFRVILGSRLAERMKKIGMKEVAYADYLSVAHIIPRKGSHTVESTINTINAMLYLIETKNKVRSIPRKWGNWNALFRRIQRWKNNGVARSILERLTDIGYVIDYEDWLKDTETVHKDKIRLGRKPIIISDFSEYYEVYRSSSMSKAEFACMLDISRQTLDNMINEYNKNCKKYG